MRKLVALLWLTLPLHADVSLAPLFSDHAVLQRDKALPIWGTGEPGEKVNVSFAGQKVSATTDKNGQWLVVLDPLPISVTGSELKVVGQTTVTSTDVVVGDVWLCAGEMNMAFPLREAEDAETEIARANLPLLRQLQVPPAAQSKPANRFSSNWSVASPASAANFSAVAYFFARDLQPRLNVPIGLINASVTTGEIESWIAEKAFENDPALSSTLPAWKKNHHAWEAELARYHRELDAWTQQENATRAHRQHATAPKPNEPTVLGPTGEPSLLFNGMIAPLLPAALRGFVWYQGESNAYRSSGYGENLRLLIASWRTYFAQGDLPFLFVQLPNFKAGNGANTEWARFRDEQVRGLEQPNTDMAVTIDLGSPNDLRPREKQEVGRRLALIARKSVYGMNVDDSGPVFESAEREGTAFRLRFTHAGTGLTAEDHPLFCFQIAGFDRKFYPASAKIDGESVLVSAREVISPVAVRYAWFNDPRANLYNGAGLPARPFRTDDW